MKKLIAYLRVSTKRQGQSGLGLEGQREAVETFAAQRGGTIVAEYVEVESGKKSDRPALDQAIGHAKLAKATLVVAKLDRLARNVAFLSALMDSGVDFVAVDNPHANRLTIHILAAVAEDEARRISERTKTALAAAKKRGVLLGSHRPGHWKGREDRRLEGTKLAAKRSAVVRRKNAEERYKFLFPTIIAMRDEQGKSFQEIANAMNAMGHTTARGCDWSAMTAKRVYDQAKAALD